MVETGKDPSDIMLEENLSQIDNNDELGAVVSQVIAENAEAVADYKKGKLNSIKFLMGAVLRATQGRADPEVVEEMLRAGMSNG